ncbi:alpha/beta fold hydrolase [Aureliella helgolandensis]|uniref:Haloalkane dehalogenase n=1 Tax=Aureliella helgolandensis TaxID=2527968 RepID=A0A518GF71_9BACT|nr:alpha/beta fold hydrolase [Aureliella helgolandensis]QDV27244.1 Haloalkane dehalogenase [Aureliella helgolandensis]
MPDWKALYPFESKFLEIPISETSADKVRMHYVEMGPTPAAGEAATEQTVLCVHGNPTWSFTYREVLKQVSNQARVIAVDHIGCGLSDKPQNYNYCLEQHVGNLARLIETLDLRRVTLLVHDWGGAIGFGAALKHPARIEKFVVLNTAAFPPPYVPWRIAACRWPWIGNWGMRQLNLFARAALHMTLNRLPRLAPAVAAGLIAPYGNWHDRVAVARFVQDIPSRKSQATWQALTHIEQGLALFADHPVRLVWGMKDWCFRPECLERLEEKLPHAKSQRLEDVGHYVMEEAPEEVIGAVREVLELGGDAV